MKPVKIYKAAINVIDSSILLLYLLLCTSTISYNVVKCNYPQLLFMVAVYAMTWGIRKLLKKTHHFFMEIVYFLYAALTSQLLLKVAGLNEKFEFLSFSGFSLMEEEKIIALTATILTTLMVLILCAITFSVLGKNKVTRYLIPIFFAVAVFALPEDSWETSADYAKTLLITHPWIKMIVFGSPTLYILLLSIGLAESPMMKWLEKN